MDTEKEGMLEKLVDLEVGRYEVLTAHSMDLGASIWRLMERERELTEALIEAVCEEKDTNQVEAELEAVWIKIVARHAAMWRLDGMLTSSRQREAWARSEQRGWLSYRLDSGAGWPRPVG